MDGRVRDTATRALIDRRLLPKRHSTSRPILTIRGRVNWGGRGGPHIDSLHFRSGCVGCTITTLETIDTEVNVAMNEPESKKNSLSRIVVVLILLLAVGAGWLGLQQVQHRRNTEVDLAAASALRELGAVVVRNATTDRTESVNLRLLESPDDLQQAWSHVLTLPGVKSVDVSTTSITPDQIMQLAGNRTIDTFQASYTELDDQGLAALVGMPLEALHVGATKVTTAGLATIAKITSLRVLTLSETSIGDDVGVLRDLPRLEWLVLGSNTISDNAFAQLAEFETLTHLSVQGATYSAAALDSLREQRKGISIDVD